MSTETASFEQVAAETSRELGVDFSDHSRSVSSALEESRASKRGQYKFTSQPSLSLYALLVHASSSIEGLQKPEQDCCDAILRAREAAEAPLLGQLSLKRHRISADWRSSRTGTIQFPMAKLSWLAGQNCPKQVLLNFDPLPQSTEFVSNDS